MRTMAALVIAAGIIGVAIYPADCVSAAQTGVELCLDIILPSLFPFFVLSTLTIELGLAGKLGRVLGFIMRPVFGVSGACSTALALGLVGGYPVGAKTAASLYQRGLCTRREAMRLLSFCNNSGPGFILGVAGAGVFLSPAAGVALYVIHISAALLVGVILNLADREKGAGGRVPEPKPVKRMGISQAFTSSVTSSFSATLNVCAFVIFFTVVIRLLAISGILPGAAAFISLLTSHIGLTSDWASRALTGLVEISSGVWSLRDAGLCATAFSMAAFMLGWGGLSVHCQVRSILGESGLPSSSHTLGKLLQAVISALMALAVFPLLPVGAEGAAAVLGVASAASGSPALAVIAALALPASIISASYQLKKQ